MNDTDNMTLSTKLEKWRKRLARLLSIEKVWKRQAAALLSAVEPAYTIPPQTYRNWEYDRRVPTGLAEIELLRRVEVVELAIKAHAAGEKVTSDMASVIATILTEHVNGTGE